MDINKQNVKLLQIQGDVKRGETKRDTEVVISHLRFRRSKSHRSHMSTPEGCGPAELTRSLALRETSSHHGDTNS